MPPQKRGYGTVDLKKMIGIRIGDLRKQKGLTQEKLAEKMGVSPKYLSSIERGKENPTLTTIINLAQSMDVEISDIFTFIEVEDPSKRKSLIASLLKEADENQLKKALKLLRIIIE
jgi:transcriptional regulator with XRE-family HTH domain